MRFATILLLMCVLPSWSWSATSSRAADVARRAPGVSEVSDVERDEAVRRYLRGRWFEQNGQPSEARDEYLRALAADPGSGEILRRLSELLAATGEPGRSLEFADRALTVDPRDARAHWLRGAALFNLGRHADALVPLEKAVALDSTEVEYWKTLARVAETADRVDLLERAWANVAWYDEDDGEAWFQLAALHARRGRFAAADSALKRAVELQPTRPGLFFLSGWVREGLGDHEAAVSFYRQHLALHSGDATTRRRLAVLLAERRRFGEALEQAGRLSTSRPRDPDAWLLHADLAFAAKKPDEGRRALARLRALAPDEPELVERSAAILARYDHGAEGVKLAEGWAAQHPGDVRGEMLAARALAFQGDVGRAVTRARAAVIAAPDSVEPRRLLARILREGKRWGEARHELDLLVAMRPEEVSFRLDLAFCLQEGGDVAAAEAAAREALRVAPEHGPSLNFLGYLLADQNRSLDEARGLLERAVAGDPDNGAYVDSMGWVYYRLGRFEDARRELERAVRLTGGDPVIHEHLGDVYVAMDRPDLAREQYRRSLAEDDNARVRNKLARLN